MFGHKGCSPLKVGKEGFMGDPETSYEGQSVLKYVHTSRAKLHKACKMAKAHLSSSQGDMKERYDKDARRRVFRSWQPGSYGFASYFSILQSHLVGSCLA